MMARSSKAPSIGRIQMRKTNFPNHHFRLATRGRSIQMGHVPMCQHFAPQKSSEPFRRRTTVKSVTDLPIGP